jgi:hypothetical protein
MFQRRCKGAIQPSCDVSRQVSTANTSTTRRVVTVGLQSGRAPVWPVSRPTGPTIGKATLAARVAEVLTFIFGTFQICYNLSWAIARGDLG